MEQQKALQILLNAVQIAQNKGAFNLQEAKLIAEAVEVFIKKPETPKVEPVVEEKTKEEPKE